MNYIVAQNGTVIPFIGPIVYDQKEDSIDVITIIDNEKYLLGTFTSTANINTVISNMIETFSFGLHYYSIPREDNTTTEDTEKTED